MELLSDWLPWLVYVLGRPYLRYASVSSKLPHAVIGREGTDETLRWASVAI